MKKKFLALSLALCMALTPGYPVAAEDMADNISAENNEEFPEFDSLDGFADQENISDSYDSNSDTMEPGSMKTDTPKAITMEPNIPEAVSTEPDSPETVSTEPDSPEAIYMESDTQETDTMISGFSDFDTTDFDSADFDTADFDTAEFDFTAGDETDDTEAFGASSAVKQKVTLYALNPGVTEISIPSDFPTSYQIPTPSGKGTTTYKIISGDSVDVSSKGLVTPRLHNYTYITSTGTSEGKEYEFTETIICVTRGTTSYNISFQLESYATYYAEKKMDDFLKNNITSSMSSYEKVDTIAKWIATNTSYSANYSGYVSLMIFGAGDCWATTSAVNYMCRKLGFTAYTRIASNDPGAGSGHRNSLVIIDGKRYIVECGYDGNAPRPYVIYQMSDEFSYEILDDGTLRLTQYEGLDTNVTIPGTINGRTVTVLGNTTFQSATVTPTSVTLPDTLTTIEKNAFYTCDKLTTITVPKNVSSIGLAAFVTDVSAPSITQINVDPQNPYFISKNGVLYDKAGTTLMFFPSGRSGEFQIPDGTIKIDDYAFYYSKNLTSVNMPDTVTDLGEGAFGDCSKLESVNLGNQLINIGNYAFATSGNIAVLTVPASVKTIGDYAFGMGSTRRIKLLCKNVTFGKSVFDSSAIIAGYEGTSVQTYAASNKISFLTFDSDKNVSLQSNWFKKCTNTYVYSGSACTPTVELSSKAPSLSEEDYEISYKNNINAGKATIHIKGKGFFTGSVDKTFTIQRSTENFYGAVFKSSGSTWITLSATGKARKPKISIPGKKEGVDFKVTYKNNTKPGYATATITGIGNYKGSRVLDFYITEKPTNTVTTPTPTPSHSQDPGVSVDLTVIPANGKQINVTISLKKSIYTYNGKAHKPSVSVVEKGKKLSSSCYSVTYKNNKNPGIATATVEGKGAYKPVYLTLDFQINPAKPTITRLTGTKKAISVKWKKNTTVTGYQIQCSTNKNFTSGRKTVRVSGKTKTSGKLTGLKAKKKYYVRIRAYKKTRGIYLYGNWSSAKTVTTK